jgi:predicted nucleic acid-binding protein
MIVVSDTSPFTALLTGGEADLLPALFQDVVIPEAGVYLTEAIRERALATVGE